MVQVTLLFVQEEILGGAGEKGYSPFGLTDGRTQAETCCTHGAVCSTAEGKSFLYILLIV